ncbi:hypothetical protein PYJP_00320 [Pyrofollis japonicus]|uniref:hypothetical protein n=1 Tax=Pyrofollis japonicus TaxID=3060460 RepID=UPI00295B994D|nr:hypothetical protein [Pyrofollis japonicus]BEP16680.1 hypothetical protein PYJP_00320 [Pyrofollis japonicus]
MASGTSVGDLVADTGKGAVLWVYVSPKSAKTYLEHVNGELIFYSAASCKDHGVNHDLIRWFSKVVGVRPIIVKGWSARKKLLLFPGVSKEKVVRALLKHVRNSG